MLLSQSEKQIMLLVDGYGYCVEPIPGLRRQKLNKRQAFFGDKFKENNVPRSRNKQRTKPGNETYLGNTYKETWKHAIQKVQGSQS